MFGIFHRRAFGDLELQRGSRQMRDFERKLHIVNQFGGREMLAGNIHADEEIPPGRRNRPPLLQLFTCLLKDPNRDWLDETGFLSNRNKLVWRNEPDFT